MDNTQQMGFPLLPKENSDGKIVMRHDFELARYNLSNLGQKIFFEVLAKIDSFSSSDSQTITLSAIELVNINVGFGKSSIYRNFKLACEEVLALSVDFYSEDKNYIYKGSVNIFRANAIKFSKDNKENIVEAYFSISPDVAPYLTELTKNMRFNQFLVDQTRQFKRATSMRLYQWLRRHHWITIRRKQTTVEVDLTEMRGKLDYKNSYKTWRDFKARILEPAIKEVCQFSDLSCDYQPGKKGRGGKILSLIFQIKNADNFKPSDDPEAKAIEGQLFEKNCPALDEGLASMIRAQIPDISENILNTLAVYNTDVIMESLLTFARSKSKKKEAGPVDYFIGIIVNKTRDFSEIQEEKTIDHRTDISWADDLTLNF